MEELSNNQETTNLELDVIKKAGLTDSQAKGYLALVSSNGLTPVEIADKSGEKRTNGYQIAEKLVGLGLATKKDTAKKMKYYATHPSNLELLAEKRRRTVEKNEQAVKNNIPGLIELFNTYNELPGARTIQGLDGIKEVYRQILATKKDVYFLRTRADKDLDLGFILKYRDKRAKMGINTYALTPPSPEAFKHREGDKELLFNRIFIPESYYDAPVEINVFGDKLALTSYGETQMTTIIDSPPVAEAMRQIMKIMIGYFGEEKSMRPVRFG